ncbi:MAG: hypothetical protein RLZZ299_2370 [Pseudomonadota bacterium]|jgi:alpha-beta hydrolase superfamily lysophospholipase
MLLLGGLLACTGATPGVIDTGTCATTTTPDPRNPAGVTAWVSLDGPDGPVRARVRLPGTDGVNGTIAVVVHGAWDAEGTALDEGDATVATAGGRTVVHFDLPGGDTPGDVPATAGVDDRRGPVARAVLATVLRWAAGETPDVEGCRLGERVPDADGPLVLVGTSNGGNLAFATLADPALALPDLAGVVAWETPAAPGFATVQWGRRDPLYVPHTCARGTDGAITCALPDTPLALRPDGEPCFDRDADGCDDGDVRLAGVRDPLTRRRMLAPELVEALDAAGLRRQDVAAAEEARGWWAARDASQAAADAVARHPALPYLLVASVQDHVLPYPDHPHVHGLGESLQAAGAPWVRLNPGRAWLREARGENPDDMVFSLAHGTGRLLSEAEEAPLEDALGAAVDELAARAGTP